MSSTSGDITTNQQLIQFKIGLEKDLPIEKDFDRIFQKLDHINMKIISTDYLKLHCPHLIGHTVLHVAYKCLHRTGLKEALSRGADFTIQNQCHLTILHLILRNQYSNEFRFGNLTNVLDNSCVNIILSAHLDTKNPTNPCDDNGMSHFHIACMANHVEVVELFLDNKVSINHAINVDSSYFAGFTGLHLAIRCCCSKVAKILLKRGASIYLKNSEGMTALQMVMENSLKFADEKLLRILGNLDQPKFLANEEIAKSLLEILNKNDIMVIEDSLNLACTMMDTSIAKKFLVKEVINNSIRMDSPFWPGYTSLHFAAHANCMNTVEILVKEGADLLVKDVYGITPLDLLMQKTELWTEHERFNFDQKRIDCLKTARLLSIMKALESGFTFPVREDLTGINPSNLCQRRCKTGEGIHAIISSSSVFKEIAFTQQIKLLSLIAAITDCNQFDNFLNRHFNGAYISIPIDSPLWPGFTPMHLVVVFASIGNFSKTDSEERFWSLRPLINSKVYYENACPKYLHMITELYNRNANIITAQDIHGCTPLHLSFRLSKMKNILHFLLSLHNKISSPRDLVDDEDLSLLHIACARDNKDLVEKLLLHSKNVNLAYKGRPISYIIETGWTPLHVAVAHNNVDVVIELLKYGADVHKQDVHGVTPIHLTFLHGSISASLLLSIQNLKECVVKDIGLSHLHVACFAKNRDAVKRLLETGSDVNLAINSFPKIADKSFEFSRFVIQSGCTPIHMIGYTTESIRVGAEIIDLLIQHNVDIFVGQSKGLPFVLKHLGYFAKVLKENTILQRLVEAKIGLTKVHIACFSRDLNWLKHLLDNGYNVNGQLRFNLKMSAGFTPLHFLMRNTYNAEFETDKLIKLLLESGANITIADAKQRTSLNMALYDYYRSKDQLERVIMMLKSQKDFSVNPINADGISHFHIACYMSETAIVKKFLERGNVDINQPTDFFSAKTKFCLGGFTPLHMAAIGDQKSIFLPQKLETVDLLLKYGADPNFQNSRGNTPLHVTECCEIFVRLTRNGGDVNILNVDGCTPLGYLLTKNFYPDFRVIVSTDQILNWLKCGSYYNSFNTSTNEGYIGLSIDVIPFEELLKLIRIVAVNVPDALKVDEMGRTIIHNVAATGNVYNTGMNNISIVQCALLIELLSSIGYDIDSQDNLGRTALHLAVEFRNLKAISALLMVGTDVNLLNGNGKTALVAHMESCKSCSLLLRKWCDVYKILAHHVHKLQLCNLEVCKSNKSCLIYEFIATRNYDRYRTELAEIDNLKIEDYPLTLLNFISETDTVAKYYRMPPLQKDAVDEFFCQEKINVFREKFDEVAGLLSLQYRKTLKRASLIEEATVSLNFLANFSVPLLCSCVIFGFLSNDDLKHLITSTMHYQNGQGSKVCQQEDTLLKKKKLRIQ